VNGARDQLLPCSALALDEHGGRAVGDLAHQRHHPSERGADPDAFALAQERVETLLERLVLRDERAALQCLAHHPDQLRALERLREEVGGAVLHRLHRFLDRAEGGQHDEVHLGRHGLRPRQQLEPGQARHPEVRQDEVDAAGLQALERGLPVRRQHDRVALAREHAVETLAHGRIIVRHQERCGRSLELSHETS
jgi:hypothetical protein